MGAPTHVHAPDAAFRGARGYVHSTDIYEEICRGAAAAGLAFEGPIDLRIKARMINVPRYGFFPGKSPSLPHPAADCAFTSAGALWTCVVTETGDAVTLRKPYDESPAATLGRSQDRRIEIAQETGLRPIEAVTALAVVLLNKSFPPATGERWMLGRLTLERALCAEDSRRLRIAVDRLIGSTMARCVMEGASGPFGSMVFIKA